jgi:arabinose-5-phosphate isomerase|tara:strand:+ start:169 stop:1134 length:966 start_codon:yes stop_codon:yes gene_type:complete
MNKKNYKKIAKKVIDLEIQALRDLKSSINESFSKAVEKITKCSSKVILSGVGKSGLVAAKIASTLSSVGTPAYALSANDCSHGDLGSISKNDILILISNSGESRELKNIIQYANRNRIFLIGIVAKKKSLLHKASDIKILIPSVNEAGLGIVPTASTTAQMAIGDALAITVMYRKKFGKLDFKKFHPSGSLGAKLKTAEDLMVVGDKIPFINENFKMKKALEIITKKKLGFLIVHNSKKETTGIITDGEIRRANQKNEYLQTEIVKKIMTRNPITIKKDTLATKALAIMNSKKITCLCIQHDKNTKKTIGVLHIHGLLKYS